MIIIIRILNIEINIQRIILIIYLSELYILIDFSQEFERESRKNELIKSMIFILSMNMRIIHHDKENKWIYKYIMIIKCYKEILNWYLNMKIMNCKSLGELLYDLYETRESMKRIENMKNNEKMSKSKSKSCDIDYSIDQKKIQCEIKHCLSRK